MTGHPAGQAAFPRVGPSDLEGVSKQPGQKLAEIGDLIRSRPGGPMSIPAIALKKILDRLLEVLVMVVMAVLVLDVLVAGLHAVRAEQAQYGDRRAGDVHARSGSRCSGAAVALGRGAHLGIDYFVGKLPERASLGTEVFVFFCVAAFSLLVMVVGGIDLVTSNAGTGSAVSGPQCSDGARLPGGSHQRLLPDAVRRHCVRRTAEALLGKGNTLPA